MLALLGCAVSVWNILLTRPLWLDEVHTLIVAERPTAALVLSDLTGGVDTAPGLMHLLMWSIGRVVSLSPVVLHLVPLVAVWLGHVFLFAALRRRFGVIASSAGTLAVLTTLLVVQMTYEARFYGLWLMFAAGFACAIGREPSRGRDLLVGVFAILLCTIHWFGVISLGIMCVAVMTVHWRTWRVGLRAIVPAAAGIIALLFTIPVLLGQRAAVTAPTWIPAPNSGQIWEMTRTFYVALVPVLAVLILLAQRLRPRADSRDLTAEGRELTAESREPRPDGREPRALWNRSIVALASLALMPVAMYMVSVVLQPSLLDRYSTVALLAWAPLVACATQALPARAGVLFSLLLLSLGALNYRRAAGGMQSYQRVFDADLRSWNAAVSRTDLPIVFQARHVQLPIAAVKPSGRERMAFLVLPDSTLNAAFNVRGPLRLMNAFFRFEREAALLHHRVYRFPPVRTQAELDTTSQFLLLASDASLPPGYKNVERFAQVFFPTHTVTRLERNLALLRR